MNGPKIGEKWSVGSLSDLIFIGQALDFAQTKYFVFKDGDEMFVIKKDKFYESDLYKKKQ
jgi:hypothetical protein